MILKINSFQMILKSINKKINSKFKCMNIFDNVPKHAFVFQKWNSKKFKEIKSGGQTE